VITLITIDRADLVSPDVAACLTANGCLLHAAADADGARRLLRPGSAAVLLVTVPRGDPPDLVLGLPDLAKDHAYLLVEARAGDSPLLAKDAFWTLTAPPDPQRLAVAVRAAAEVTGLRRDLRLERMALTSFNDVARALTSTLKLKEVLNLIAEKTTELVPCEAWSLLMVDQTTEDLTFEIVAGPKPEVVQGFHIRIGEGIAGWVAREGQPILVEDAQKDPRFYPAVDDYTGFSTHSVLCVPLMSKERVVGVIELINKPGGGTFTRHDQDVASTLASYAAIAIENARLYEQAEELAITDDTTQIPNMRYFHHILNREVTRARRRETPLSLLFVDLDKFKQVNDTYGHMHGSRLLREVAHLLRRGLRAVDLVARYGGDEFVALLPDTEPATAYLLAERLRGQIEAYVYRGDPDLTIKITCSIGVASFPDEAKTKEELVRFADQAMYRAKGARRNFVYSGLKDHMGQLVIPQEAGGSPEGGHGPAGGDT
jgi:diguanylate cyclase (GGDEF)-like protein